LTIYDDKMEVLSKKKSHGSLYLCKKSFQKALFLNFGVYKSKIDSLSAGNPRASSVANDLRGLAWLAFPAGVSPIFAHSFFKLQKSLRKEPFRKIKGSAEVKI